MESSDWLLLHKPLEMSQQMLESLSPICPQVDVLIEKEKGKFIYSFF